MNGEAFLIYVETMLAPSLSQGDIVVIDNLSAHKVAGVRAADLEPRGPSFSTCRPIRPNSIPSRWRSLSSRHCCARPPREPETYFGTQSPTSSPLSRRTNAPTTSLTQDMLVLSGKCSSSLLKNVEIEALLFLRVRGCADVYAHLRQPFLWFERPFA